jgi:hypothetical protein
MRDFFRRGSDRDVRRIGGSKNLKGMSSCDLSTCDEQYAFSGFAIHGIFITDVDRRAKQWQ